MSLFRSGPVFVYALPKLRAMALFGPP